MRRTLLSIAAALLGAVAMSAYSPEIRDIDISLTLHKDGSASVVERWDVCAADGTEWYLVRKISRYATKLAGSISMKVIGMSIEASLRRPDAAA